MTFMRSTTLALWLTTITAAAAISTPIRDLSQETIADSQCDWPNFEEDEDLNGVMVLYKGHKLAEWRNPNGPGNDWFSQNYVLGTTQHAQYSVTKTWVSVLIGMLYRDGFMDWETEHPDKITLGEIFPEQIWEDIWDVPFLISGGSKVDELKAITLGELMSMRTGYAENGISSPFDSTLVRDLDRLVAWWHPHYRRGTIESQTCFNCGDYLSNSGIVNYIIKEKTRTYSNPRGWDPLDYARQTSDTLPNGNVGLFEALGMEKGSYTWDRDRDDVARGAFGLWIDLEDMAKFGQLLLQGGTVMLDGVARDIIPSYYLEEMTKTQSRMKGTDLPYGWQVWNWGEDDDGDSGFCAEGLGWQSICVFPKQETVVAIQAPVSFGLDTFEANIQFRNDAIKAIRDGIVCGSNPTAAPINSSPVTPPTQPPVSSTSAPTSVDNGNNVVVGDTIQDPIDGGDSNNGDEDIDGDDTDRENESEQVLIGSANGKDDDDDAPVGLIIGLVLLSALLCVFCALFFCSKRNKKNKDRGGAPRSVDCKMIPSGGSSSQDDELNKMYEAKLNGDDDLCSVDTDDESGEIAYAVADLEQRSY